MRNPSQADVPSLSVWGHAQGLTQLGMILCLTFTALGCSKGTLINTLSDITPNVTRVVPSAARNLGGTEVAIIGSGFLRGAEIKLGDIECKNPEVVSDTLIVCTTPQHSVARVDVNVTNPNKLSGTLKNGFSFSDAIESQPGQGIVAGGGVTQGADRRAISSIGEIGTPHVQRGTDRMVIGGIQGALGN